MQIGAPGARVDVADGVVTAAGLIVVVGDWSGTVDFGGGDETATTATPFAVARWSTGGFAWFWRTTVNV